MQDNSALKPDRSIKDWLLEDHRRNDFKRDVQKLKHDVHRVRLYQRFSSFLLVLIAGIQLMIWIAQ